MPFGLFASSSNKVAPARSAPPKAAVPPPASNTNRPAPPPHFCCPITLAIMEEPVIAPDGNSYELSALQQWAASQIADGHNPPKLPTTGNPFTVDQLVPNRGLKDAIVEWRVANGLQPAAPTPSTSQPAPAPRAPLALNIPATRYFKSPCGEAYVAVPPASGPQRHLHVVVVVDVSGSMDVVAEMKDETGEKAEMANTVLDIVKYAAKATAHMLGPNDAFSLVTFSTSAKVVLKSASTRNDDDLKAIDTAIGRLRTEGMTNLGEGLRCALQSVIDSHQEDPNRLNVVMMLTDGQPNSGPVALDVLGSFRRSKKDVPANPATKAPATTQGDIIANHTIVNTYAFGYARSASDLSSSLMFDVAALGNGTYGYIPDIGFLGTQFIHCLANMRCIASVAASVLGPDVPNQVGLWFAQYGQTAFSCRNIAALETVDFTKPIKGIRADGADNDAPQPLTAEEIEAVMKAMPRASTGFRAANTLLKLLRGDESRYVCTYDGNGRRTGEGANDAPKTEDEAKEAFAAIDAAPLEGLEEDIKSQIVIAFRPDYYARWGLHYLFGWLSAHHHQICNNFKDKSVATHKTPMVAGLHDTYNDIFNMMPPPEPTVRDEPIMPHARVMSPGLRGGARMASAAPMTLAMNASAAAPLGGGGGGPMRSRRTIHSSAMINSSYNPCVHEDTRLLLADGTWRAARDVCPGDVVSTVARPTDTPSSKKVAVVIDHIIRTQCLGGMAQLVCFPPMEGAADGLRITAWHPVLVKDCPAQVARAGYVTGTPEWLMPADTGYPVEQHPCSHVYSFTVKHTDGAADSDAQPNAPAIVAEGVAMIYLAHNRTEAKEGSPAVAHKFFGTDAVLAQLLEAHPTHRKHEFAHAPVIKAACEHQSGAVACGWDMGKYAGGEW